MFSLLIKGAFIGFSIAAPVGPIGLLCINRSLQSGMKAGLATGAGAALADGVYGVVAGFGLTAITNILLDYQFWIRLGGGIFLLYLGIKIALAKPKDSIGNIKEKRNLLHFFVSTIFLTLTNPLTILSFIGVFAGLGLGSQHVSYTDAIELVSGVILGSMLWWFILSTGVANILKHRLNQTTLLWINRLSAFIITCFGLAAIISIL